jgi:hypothetical protein
MFISLHILCTFFFLLPRSFSSFFFLRGREREIERSGAGDISGGSAAVGEDADAGGVREGFFRRFPGSLISVECYTFKLLNLHMLSS